MLTTLALVLSLAATESPDSIDLHPAAPGLAEAEARYRDLDPDKPCEDQTSLCDDLLKTALLQKPVRAKIAICGSSSGLNLNIDGTWDRERHSRQMRATGIGVQAGEQTTITLVRAKSKHLEVQFGRGGYGTFEDTFAKSWFERQKQESLQTSGQAKYGGRINLHFNRKILGKDLEPRTLLGYLSPVLETTSLRRDQNAPIELRAGMTQQEVEEAAGQPDTRVALADKTIYVYPKLKVTFTDGKVSGIE